MIRVIISGATGKVGTALLAAVNAAADIELAAAAAPSLGMTLPDALASTPADVVVDFTAPDFAEEACRLSVAAKLPLVLGTTGVDGQALQHLGEEAAAAGVQLFHAPNFAVGAVLMMRFAEEASRHLPAAEIVELHADTKRDAPSGTSKATAARMQGDVPIHSVRLPGLVAHQAVILGGTGETLTIRHDTTSRDAFAPGVLLAVRTIRDLDPGLTVGLEALLARAG
jgi:4-hydroxy-tetrahydrodipicolinate reductase